MSLGCAATLSACGGGGGTGSPASPATSNASASATAASTAPKSHVTIYLDGGSTNWGADIDSTVKEQSPAVGQGVVGRASPSPAQLMQTDFDAALGAGVVTVIDGATPGATFQADLQATGVVAQSISARLGSLTTPADLVLSNFEINDQYVLAESPQTYASWEQQWVQTVKAAGATPVLQEPNPICEPGFNIPVTDEFVAQTRQLASTQGITLLPTYDAFKLYPLWNLTTGLMSSDCVHPNETGYAFKEAHYFPVLLPVVRKLLAQ